MFIVFTIAIHRNWRTVKPKRRLRLRCGQPTQFRIRPNDHRSASSCAANTQHNAPLARPAKLRPTFAFDMVIKHSANNFSASGHIAPINERVVHYTHIHTHTRTLIDADTLTPMAPWHPLQRRRRRRHAIIFAHTRTHLRDFAAIRTHSRCVCLGRHVNACIACTHLRRRRRSL